MKTLSQRLDEYLALRRAMGFDLSFDERVLRKFVNYGDEIGEHLISTALFLDWKENYGSADETASGWFADLPSGLRNMTAKPRSHQANLLQADTEDASLTFTRRSKLQISSLRPVVYRRHMD